MTIREWMNLLKYKNEHYDISDEFTRLYQQGNTGYIEYAIKVGHPINKNKAEPSQRWHLFESYLFRMFAEEKLFLDSSAKKVYNGFKCPELLLWIAEASGVERSKIEKASKRAKETIEVGSDRGVRSKAAQEIKKVLSWEVIEKSLNKKI